MNNHPECCPKCLGELTKSSPASWERNYCHACKGVARWAECVVCGVQYPIMDTGIPWNNHQCDPKKIARIEWVRNGIEGRKERTKTYDEKLRDGFESWKESER